MADDDLYSTAIGVLNTIIRFIEDGDVSVLIEQEIKNYFLMCQQVEIYQEKFLQKGFVLAVDQDKGAYLFSTTTGKVEYDLSLLADRLLDKFCRNQHSNTLLSSAVRIYIDSYGASRFTRFLEVMTSTKGAFNLTTVIGRAYENGYNLEGPVFMDCLENVALGPRGMPRVKDIINELLVEDFCAETVVAMLATENKEAEYLTEIKQMILENLEKKFAVRPKGRIWLMMVCSLNLMGAVNSFTPFMSFVLKLVGSLSESIIFDPVKKTYYSPPGCLTYRNLVHIMAKFYRNPPTTQDIVNFVFNQFKSDSTVWGSVLTACHNHPNEDNTTDTFFESLYNSEYTDPNVSSESLQLMLKSILNADHLQMAETLGWTPSRPSVAMKSDVQQLKGPRPVGSQDFSGKAAAKELIGAPLGRPPIQIDSKPASVKQEFPGPEMAHFGLCGGFVQGHHDSQVVVTTPLSRPVDIGALQRISSHRWPVAELERRPLSSRTKRYPKHMDDYCV